jgi:polysaccharide biosynthesis protein VpsK
MATPGTGTAPPDGAPGDDGSPIPGAAAGARSELFGCPFDPIGMSDAVARAVGWCEGDRRPRTIVTVNAALVVAMRGDPDLARACRAGDLVLADGVPIVWASRVAGARLPARVAGVDLMGRLLEAAAARGLPVFFLGAREEVVRKLAAQCTARYPGLWVAGWRNGYFDRAREREVVDQIRRSGAAMLFVGMPSPFKEVWCERWREELGVPVLMGVGGSFDVLAGFIPRAPRWMQAAGLEWLWRLAMEPRRLWKRYLVTNALFVARVLAEAVRRRSARRAA